MRSQQALAYKIAQSQLGVSELTKGENPRIIEYHEATIYKATTDEVPWCSSFVNWDWVIAAMLLNPYGAVQALMHQGLTHTPIVNMFKRAGELSWEANVDPSFVNMDNNTHVPIILGTLDASAISWMSWGVKGDGSESDIAVYKRSGGNHVCWKSLGGEIGGNQNNEVCLKIHDKSNLLGYRRMA